ncbi:zinc finger protein 653 [Spea bombifrons]|uniref:zinc finger protein 653 n=1 Tax=Spea bombifrons TaxID=233779 RepID=UPI00234B0061|nr:zinc finger protein 653 [Spea bombifrons]
MATSVAFVPGSEEDEEPGRKARGRPRLTDTDRARRRLESRKKYDGRRVYLGEAHGDWVLRRESGGGEEPWSDAKLAAYLLALESDGKPCQDKPRNGQHPKHNRSCVNSLLSLVTWYQNHRNQCPHEPALSELDTSHVVYVTAVWQCHGGHQFYQDLQGPVKTLNQSGSDNGASSGESSSNVSPIEQTPDICHSPEHTVHTLYTQPSGSLTEGGTLCTDGTETVVCVPMGSGTGDFFEGVTQEALGQVVAAGCPSQVIIIAGSGYETLTAEGIQLDVAGGSDGEEEGACTALEAVSSYTQTEPEDQVEEQQLEGAVAEEDSLYGLQREEVEVQKEPDLPMTDSETAQEPTQAAPALVQDFMANITQHAPKETEKRRSRRCRVQDGDGVLETFHCQYEGCTQVYTALNSFHNHMNLVHRKGRTKVCTEPGCGKRFYLSNHLRRHMIIHTGIREFICETCGKSFKRKSHLEVHRRTHTGETPLQCEVCGFQCRQRASLNWHMKKHQAEIQYSFSCEHCGKLFEKRDSVKFHKLKSHPEGRMT